MVENTQGATMSDTETEVRDLSKMDWQLVRLDETQYYADGFLKSLGVKRAYGVYLYDKGEVTHCCEFTPSYYLLQIDIAFELEDQFHADHPLFDPLCSEADTELRQAQEWDGKYVHCHEIDALPDTERHAHGPAFDGVVPEGVDYEGVVEGLTEHYQGNPVW